MKRRHLISLHDLSADKVQEILTLAAEVKAHPKQYKDTLKLKTLAMLFEKPSLRTRVTFETGMTQLGGHAIYLAQDVGLGKRESVSDIAKNLGRWVDGIMARTFAHKTVTDLAESLNFGSKFGSKLNKFFFFFYKIVVLSFEILF